MGRSIALVTVLGALAQSACSLLDWNFQGASGGSGGAGVGGASVSSSSSSGTGAGTGGSGGVPSTPKEVCGAPGDEDNNGLSDCADPACACTSAAPSGWSGPFTLHEGSSSSPPSCEPSSLVVFQGGADLIPEPAQCSACTCGNPTNVTCSGDVLSLYGSNGCAGAIVGTVSFALNNVCKVAPSFNGSVNIPAIDALNVKGTCSTTAQQAPTLPAPNWGRLAVGCSGGAAGAGCNPGEVCADKPSGNEAVCISKPGEVDCPLTTYTARRLYYSDTTDTRSCTDCTCGVQADGCSGTYIGYSDTGCSAQVFSEPATSTHCVSIAAASLSFVPGAPTNPTCAPKLGSPTGCNTPASPVTVCCTSGADPCPKGMVQVSPPGVAPYCVDATEVTQQAYAEFLATSPPTAGQPAYCNFNGSYQPTNWPPAAGQETLPVTGVDWCDAYAYCAWAGKRLCGQIGGGAVASTSYTDASASQWYAACSKGGAQEYPYGDTHVDGVCNDGKNNNNVLAKVQSFPCCTGGYSGLYDMVGNVQEWEDSCAQQVGQSDDCRVRGNSFNGNGSLGCSDDRTQARSYRAARVGFRCCGP